MRLMIAIFLLCINFSIFASDSCSKLTIHISNQTNGSCQFFTHYLHGVLVEQSTPPRSLMPNAYGKFSVKQTIYGPHVIINIRCTNPNTTNVASGTVSIQQNYCMLLAGNIHAQTNSEKLNLYLSKEPGSYFFDQHGVAYLEIRQKIEENSIKPDGQT